MVQRIVVGVDGSEESRRALEWAIAEARLRGATVEAVSAWAMSYEAGLAWGYGVQTTLDVESMEKSALEALDAIVTGVAGPDPGVEIIRSAQQGHPADVLLDAADGAELLVVGSRGHGGFSRLLLGSVSTACVQHARCPVVVIPRQPERDEESPDDKA